MCLPWVGGFVTAARWGSDHLAVFFILEKVFYVGYWVNLAFRILRTLSSYWPLSLDASLIGVPPRTAFSSLVIVGLRI